MKVRLLKKIAKKHSASISLIDVSLIPDNFDIETWLYYAVNHKVGFIDSQGEIKQITINKPKKFPKRYNRFLGQLNIYYEHNTRIK